MKAVSVRKNNKNIEKVLKLRVHGEEISKKLRAVIEGYQEYCIEERKNIKRLRRDFEKRWKIHKKNTF